MNEQIIGELPIVMAEYKVYYDQKYKQIQAGINIFQFSALNVEWFCSCQST